MFDKGFLDAFLANDGNGGTDQVVAQKLANEQFMKSKECAQFAKCLPILGENSVPATKPMARLQNMEVRIKMTRAAF